MASEELQGGDLLNQAQPSAPAPTTLPPYPEMILTAIMELNESNGSNKSTISKQIEATYGTLPPVHITLLTHHLNRMKSAGQLVFTKNNYLIADPNTPPRRGRGRPPKPKTALPESVSLSPRPRGRPPKSRDPTAPGELPKPKAPSLSGKKRGRPPKALATTGLPDVSPTQPESLSLTQPESPKPKVVSPAPSPSPSGKKRGRPPKAAATTGSAISTQPDPSGGVVSRGRGRPPKVKPNPTVPVGA